MDREAEDPVLEDSKCCHRKAGCREHGQGCHTSSLLGGLPWTPPQDLVFEVGIFRWPGIGPMPLVPGSREEGVLGPLHLRQWETGLDPNKMYTMRESSRMRTGFGSCCTECSHLFLCTLIVSTG